MESTRRRLLRESNSDSGAIVDEMKTYSHVPVANDGIHEYGNVRIKPISSGPFLSSDEIELPLVSSNFDVIEFSNTYIHLKTRIALRCTNPPELSGPASDPLNKMLNENQFVMIGLKASPHIIRDYRFKHEGTIIPTTVQSRAVTESFLYSTFKAKSEIANKKFVFSPYDEVSVMENSLCGIYVPLKDLKSEAVYKDVDIIIPLREILAMEAFNEYPRNIFGELRLVFHVTAEAFVYTEVNPQVSIRKGIVSGKIDRTIPHLSDLLAIDGDTFNYQHSFEQIGIPSAIQFVSGYDSENNKFLYTTQAEFQPHIDEIKVQEAWVDAKGYRMNFNAARELANHFSQHPFAVCAQKVIVQQFPSGPTPSGLSTSMNVRLNHVTDIEILHPTDSRQRTVFRNILHDSYQVQIGNKRFPDQLTSTVSPQFHEQQIQSSDFDSIFEANDEYEHSLTDNMIEENEDGTVTVLKPTTDNTSFVPIFSCERAGSGGELWFDGLDAINEKVELNSRPIYQGKADVYYKDANTPNPMLCMCSEAYWIFRLIDGRPNVQFVSGHTYEEGFNNPSIDAC